MELITIKITKGHPNLNGKTLTLKKVSEMLYKCINTDIEIVDTWDELESMKNYNANIFFDLHLFHQTNTGLQFIDEIELLKPKYFIHN